jgi:SAM-dependent methyltransferase
VSREVTKESWDGSGDPVGANRATYDRVAPLYRQRSGTVYPRLVEMVAGFAAAVPRGGWVADIGCGPGRDTALLREAGLRVIGLDLSLGMLRADGLPDVAQADMRALPLADGALAGIWCSAALLHIPLADAPRVLAGFARVSAPGGVLHLQVAEGDGEHWEIDHYPGERRFFAHHREPELTAALARVGFTVHGVRRNEGHRSWLIMDATRTG